jgi:GAF domain-containing protein
MENPPPAAFAAVARSLGSVPAVDDTLEQIVALALDALGCEYAGVSYANLRSKGIETGAASHEVVRQGDAAQREVGEGPCLQAMRDGSTYLVHDTATDLRWPRWGQLAETLGLRSVIAVRLFDQDDTLGALNLYASTPAAFTAEDVTVAEIYAAHAAVALGRIRREMHLNLAIESRHLVGMAQGILMERFALDADGAFSVLRRYSQECNMKLRVVAQQLLDTRTLPGEKAGLGVAAAVVADTLATKSSVEAPEREDRAAGLGA